MNEFVPFMFVNSADIKSAQIFTIAHKLVHIWLGKSAGFDNANLLPADSNLEKLCDKVAAELLVPEVIFKELWKNEKDFKKLSSKFKVSKIVIARRALDLGIINKQEFFKFYNEYKRVEIKK